jgi:hypothetical protein
MVHLSVPALARGNWEKEKIHMLSMLGMFEHLVELMEGITRNCPMILKRGQQRLRIHIEQIQSGRN